MKHTLMLAMLLASSAFAGHPSPKPDPTPSSESTAVGVGVGVGIADVDNHVKNTNVGVNTQGQSLANDIKNTNYNDASSRNTNNNLNSQSQTATSDQHQDQSQSANNEGNSQTTNISSEYHDVRNAPAFAIASVYPTAGCQSGVSLGGSGVNGGGGFAFSFSKKECEAMALAQNFSALGMPDTACDIMKTTKAFKRAAELNPQLKSLSCTPKPVAMYESARPEVDMSQYVKRDELAERDRRIIEKATSK